MNLREIMPLELQERRLQLLKELKAIDEELGRRARPIITSIDDHRKQAAHYAQIGKRPY